MIDKNNIKTRQLKNLSTSIAQVLGISALSLQLAHAGDTAVFEVNSTSDQSTAGLTTLREAIELANLTADSTIQFDPAVFSEPQTIILKQGDILISSAVSIDGPGKDLLSIDGAGASRIFTLDDGTTDEINVSISDVTLTNGNGASTVNDNRGGCVMSYEQLSISDSVITGCVADGLNGGGGGGVWSRFSSLVIDHSEIINNYARFRGGGVYIRSESAYITNTTISGNTANRGGEAGGGINSNGADLIITNSTISNNQVIDGNAGGLFITGGAELTMLNSTVLNNAGQGINPSGRVNISNSLIAGHPAGDCNFSDLDVDSDNQNNMDTDGSCDVQATNHITVSDPMLEPLANFGGPSATHRPLPGSPVIDAGNDQFCESIDQRGNIRPQDGDDDGSLVCDIGAVEVGDLTDLIFADGFNLDK